MEDSFHRLPLLGSCGAGFHKLEDDHIVLPFLLSGQCGEAIHGSIPVEPCRYFNNHKQAGIKQINFHFQDADFANAGGYLRPDGFAAMAATVFGYQLRIVTKLEGAADTFYRLTVLFGGVTFD